MELDRLIPNVRPRSNWEASDLGVLMARRWYGPLLLCFAAPMAVVAVLAVLLLHSTPGWCYFALWWFKPLYERLPLYYVSRAIFADPPDVKTLLRHPLGALGPGLLPALTYNRFSLRRSFVAPVAVLEGQAGARAAARIRTLAPETEAFANWLTILGIHVEGALSLGAFAAVALLLPDGMIDGAIEVLVTGDDVTWFEWLNVGLGLVAIIAFGPIYVACGFALYLNRRVELEAWDIEIAFQRLANRVAPKQRGVTIASAAMLLTLTIASALAVVTVPVTHADTTQPVDLVSIGEPAADSRQVIEAVMADPDFHDIEIRRYPKFLQDWLDSRLDQSDDEPEGGSDLLEWVRGLAMLMEVLLWITVALLVLWLAYQLRSLKVFSSRTRSKAPTPPSSVFGIDLAEETLPTDVAAAAHTLWQQGDLRASLSLLLRDQLLRLVAENGCRFSSGDTEQDCLNEVRGCAAKEKHSAFAKLLNLWLRVAYAHRTPMDQEFELVRRALADADADADAEAAAV